MGAKRWTGTALQGGMTTRKRWDGAAFVDLTVGKRWNGAAFEDITELFGSSLSVSVSPAYAEGSIFDPEPAPSFVNVTTNSVTASASGGTGPYTYAWSYVSGGAGFSANNPSADTTSFTATIGKNQEKSAIWKVVATDSLAATTEATVTVTASYLTDL